MIKKELDVVEVGPKIFVYKNLFKDIDETFQNLENQEGGLISDWTPWAKFGDYLNPPLKDHPHSMTVEYIKGIQTSTEKEEKHKNLVLELIENFYIATMDYAEKNNVDINTKSVIVNKDGESFLEWTVNGPSIARYKIHDTEDLSMTYHSDYTREPIRSPGYKFAITGLAYFNDNYEGGEIDFIVDRKAYMYKPEKGDFLVFPSGHPDVLPTENLVYIHGVLPNLGAKKYLSRMYWMKYEPGSKEWFDKEAEFGKELWQEMQVDIMNKFREDYPNKRNADNEERVR